LTASAPLYKASATNIQLLYNTSQFEVNSSNQLQIKAGILAPAYHTQDISTINGLQSALDGKEPMITAGTTAQYWRGDKTWQTMPTSLPASDVYSWAKASLKPGYSWTEIGSRPTALSQFTNDLGNYGGFVTGTPWTGCGYITGTDNRLSDARPASDVYAWAKAASKPSYSYSEVGAAAASHSHDYATHRSEGSQFVDYAWGMYDQYRGGWRPSGDLKVAYSAQADNSQNSTLLEGYGASNFLGKNGTSYYQASDWIQLSGAYGLYCTLNEAHFFPNDGTYGAWKISGSRNGWSGIEFADSTTCLMVNYSASGIYNLNYGWQIQWSGGVLQVSKSSYGGPTMATVLDSSNYSSYALPITGGTVNGNITASYMYAYNFIGNSDRSLKENIRALNPEKLNIDYKSFFFKDEPGVLRYGAIAQEVKVDYPELVFRLESGKFGISYQDLLVREVAYLKSITEQLINENSSLRFDLMNIQNQLSQRA
jgi:hypothetical protein